jgi:hypothetical protein
MPQQFSDVVESPGNELPEGTIVKKIKSSASSLKYDIRKLRGVYGLNVTVGNDGIITFSTASGATPNRTRMNPKAPACRAASQTKNSPSN